MEARPGIEPGCTDLQSAASPLRHRAIRVDTYQRVGERAASIQDPFWSRNRLVPSKCLSTKRKRQSASAQGTRSGIATAIVSLSECEGSASKPRDLRWRPTASPSFPDNALERRQIASSRQLTTYLAAKAPPPSSRAKPAPIEHVAIDPRLAAGRLDKQIQAAAVVMHPRFGELLDPERGEAILQTGHSLSHKTSHKCVADAGGSRWTRRDTISRFSFIWRGFSRRPGTSLDRLR
jgi:hypothetical protein